MRTTKSSSMMLIVASGFLAASETSAQNVQPGAEAKSFTESAAPWMACPPPSPAGCQLAVLNGDPAKPNSDIFLRIPAGGIFPPHSHSSAERMVLVSGQLEVKYRGTPQTVLMPGTYAYGPAGRPHRAKCISATSCTLFIAFEGPVDVVPFAGSVE